MRRTPLAVTAVLVVALVLGCGTTQAPHPGAVGTAASATPTATAAAPAAGTADPYAGERRRALPALLQARGKAVVGRDRAAWTAGLDPRATAFVARQEQTFANLAAIGFSTWSYDVVSDLPADPGVVARLGGPARLVHVQLRVRIAGFDPGDVLRDQYLTVVRRDGRWLIADDADPMRDPGDPQARDLWDLGPVSVVRGPRVLVLGHAARATLQRFEGEAERAIDAVSAVVGTGWARRTVVEVPGSQADLESLLGRIDRSISIDSYAAVAFPEPTDTRGPDGRALVPTRVALNPRAFDGIGDRAGRAVLTHEMTHVAWFDLGGAVAEWLTEGFADYVGYRGVPDAGIAPDVVAQAGRGTLPTQLPTAGDFQHGDSVGLAYQQSTTVCRAIAQRWGQGKLVALYRAAAGSSERDPDVATETAMRAVLGTTPDGLVRVWRDYLRADARART